MRTRTMNKGVTPYAWYITELIKKNNIFEKYNSVSSTRANNSWNHHGEKRLKFPKLLLNFIYKSWDDIFDSDSQLWAIKENVIQDITHFLDENTHLCEYAWKGIFQQYINESFCSYPQNDMDAIKIRDCYLKQLSEFIKRFDIFTTNYHDYYKDRMKKFIIKHKIMNFMKRLRPILLFVNRYYYQIFSFSNISLIKSILYRSNTFYETIGDHLTSPLISYHVNDAKYLELIRITMRRTSDLVSNKNHFKFVGLVLNNLFCKDVALRITEYI